MRKLKEALLRLLEATPHSCDRILWELRVSYDHLMELIAQKVGTLSTTMTIIDREEATAWPEIDMLELRLNNIQDDGHPIFVVASNHALMCIGCIGNYHAILLRCILSRVVILAELDNLFLLHLHILFTLRHSHLHTTVLNDVVRSQILFLISSFCLFYRLQFFIILLNWLFRRFWCGGRFPTFFAILSSKVLFQRVKRVLNNCRLVFDQLVCILAFVMILLVLLAQQLCTETISSLRQRILSRFLFVFATTSIDQILLHLVCLSLYFFKRCSIESTKLVQCTSDLVCLALC